MTGDDPAILPDLFYDRWEPNSNHATEHVNQIELFLNVRFRQQAAGWTTEELWLVPQQAKEICFLKRANGL